jgi:hypothetical protein
MAAEFRNSMGMLIFQMVVSAALVVLFAWMHFGPRQMALGSWEQMLYFGFFPAFVIYDCIRLKRRFSERKQSR